MTLQLGVCFSSWMSTIATGKLHAACLAVLGLFWSVLTVLVDVFLDSLSFEEFLHWSEFAWKSRVMSLPKSMPSGRLANSRSDHLSGMTLESVREADNDVLEETSEEEDDDREETGVKQILNPYQFEMTASVHSTTTEDIKDEGKVDGLLDGIEVIKDATPTTASAEADGAIQDAAAQNRAVKEESETEELSDWMERVKTEASQKLEADAISNANIDTGDVNAIENEKTKVKELSDWMEIVKGEART